MRRSWGLLKQSQSLHACAVKIYWRRKHCRALWSLIHVDGNLREDSNVCWNGFTPPSWSWEMIGFGLLKEVEEEKEEEGEEDEEDGEE